VEKLPQRFSPWQGPAALRSSDGDCAVGGNFAKADARAGACGGGPEPRGQAAGGPATEGLVRVVVNGNAHHVHRSAGRHDDNVYQMAFEIPIGGPGRVTAAAAGQVIAEIEKTPAELWGLIGQWAGAVALVAACLPATQGLKRHAGLKPRFKRIHYFLLTGFIFAGALHIVASSTTLRWLVGA